MDRTSTTNCARMYNSRNQNVNLEPLGWALVLGFHRASREGPQMHGREGFHAKEKTCARSDASPSIHGACTPVFCVPTSRWELPPYHERSQIYKPWPLGGLQRQAFRDDCSPVRRTCFAKQLHVVHSPPSSSADRTLSHRIVRQTVLGQHLLDRGYFE